MLFDFHCKQTDETWHTVNKSLQFFWACKLDGGRNVVSGYTRGSLKSSQSLKNKHSTENAARGVEEQRMAVFLNSSAKPDSKTSLTLVFMIRWP